MKLEFTKMHGCGNDYIYFDCFKQKINNPEKMAFKLSDRHFGIGGDGIVLICPSAIADAKMRMFNADGSEGKMCGNAIRCVAKYVFENKICQKDNIEIETLSGIKNIKVNAVDGKVESAVVNMGKAEFICKNIPVKSSLFDENEEIINQKLVVDNKEYKINCVSMGNPHCVIFGTEPDDIELEKIGPKFETNEIFPHQTNTEFAFILNKNTVKMRVWERGSGETLACGTGACGVVSVAVKNGFCKENEEVKVILKGGELIIKYTNDAVYMTGPCTMVFKGEIFID